MSISRILNCLERQQKQTWLENLKGNKQTKKRRGNMSNNNNNNKSNNNNRGGYRGNRGNYFNQQQQQQELFMNLHLQNKIISTTSFDGMQPNMNMAPFMYGNSNNMLAQTKTSLMQKLISQVNQNTSDINDLKTTQDQLDNIKKSLDNLINKTNQMATPVLAAPPPPPLPPVAQQLQPVQQQHANAPAQPVAQQIANAPAHQIQPIADGLTIVQLTGLLNAADQTAQDTYGILQVVKTQLTLMQLTNETGTNKAIAEATTINTLARNANYLVASSAINTLANNATTRLTKAVKILFFTTRRQLNAVAE